MKLPRDEWVVVKQIGVGCDRRFLVKDSEKAAFYKMLHSNNTRMGIQTFVRKYRGKE